MQTVDDKKQDHKVAQSAKDDSATVPLQHQFELPVDCSDDVEVFSMPATPHDRNVMPKARRDVTAPSGTASRVCNFDMFRIFVKNSNSMCDVSLRMWLLFSLFPQFSKNREQTEQEHRERQNMRAHTICENL